MNINFLNIFFILFFLCQITFAYAHQNNIKHAPSQYWSATEKTTTPANIKVSLSAEGNKTYRIKLSGKWVKGSCVFQGTGKPYAHFADLNFDGNLDAWVTGFTDSQGRSRCSDVWLFNPMKKKYEYDATLSKINNLELAPQEKKLEGGVSNCGCAGQCFYHDTYIWQSGSLLNISRRKQDCDSSDTILYEELILKDGELKVIRQEIGKPDDNEYLRRQKGVLNFFEWDAN